MIEWISSWAEQIIVCVIIATIIEMILPNGNNKKYVKAVIGVYVLFTIISPILTKITNVDFENINYEEYFNEMDTYETMSKSLTTSNNKSVEEIYKDNLIQDMKLKLEEQGYDVENVNMDIEFANEANYGKIKKISIVVYEKNEETKQDSSIAVNKIENVNIGSNKNTLSDNKNNNELSKTQIDEIKSYISSVYEVNKNNIQVNE